jgi:DEAD/DEAH box helicase domain-containing protein
MLPSIVESELQEAVRRFLQATFPMTTQGFRREDGSTMLDALLAEPDAIFKGPYLSLGLPFRKVGAEEPLPFEHVSLPFAPYRHQMRAFERLSGPSPRSTLVATGTGSGKTECFALPIFDYCAGRKEKGIKAIIVYPMNALATDQARRFAKEIHDQPALKGRVSAGLYVGDTEQSPKKTMTRDSVITCKDTLRQHPPDILLTNYKMLDFLLMRPRDQALWRHNAPGSLRYLVVDELHTFDGAQGTDLACLIRRLRERLSVGETLACVGTSATIGGPDSLQELRDYAARVFSGDFDEDSVVQEDRLSPDEFLEGAGVDYTAWPTSGVNRALHDREVDYLRAQALLWFGEDAPPLDAARPGEAMKARFELAERLRRCGAFRELLQAGHGVLDINLLIEQWTNRFRIDRSRTRQMLDSLLALVSWARRPKSPEDAASDAPPDGQPFVNVRMQLWLRELSRLVATVDGLPALHFADDLTDLTDPLHLPVVHCRECHATGWASLRNPAEQRLESDLQSIYRAYFGNHPDVSLLFPAAVPPSVDGKGIHGVVCPKCGQLHARSGGQGCPGCGAETVVAVWEPDMRRAHRRGDAHTLKSHHDCPFCGASQGLSLVGSRAASLSSVLIGRLFDTPYNDHRKLIAFSDSVQDAAHRAGFFGARTYSTLVRSAISRFIHAQGKGMPLSVVATEMPRFWKNRAGSGSRFVGTFIAPNMEWLRDYEHLKEQGSLPAATALTGMVEQRLTWEVIQAFGLRARIGRTLERSLTAAVGVDAQALRDSAHHLTARLSEEIGPLRDLDPGRTLCFLLGTLWRFRVRGAFYHPMLDGYIQSRGKTFELYRTPHMPNYGGAARPPAMLTLSNVSSSFEALHREGQSWYYAWFNKTLAGRDAVLASAEYQQAIRLTVERLVKDGFLIEKQVGGESVWGLEPGQWICTTTVSELVCGGCGHRIQVPGEDAQGWHGMPCLHSHCSGVFAVSPRVGGDMARQVGWPHRLVASEHTALLDAERRLDVERSFIYGQEPWDINLLSATPTLEMGIDIGDLSSVLLCSVPPHQANYLQRIGRAGRRDGNALTVTVANAHKHDLYFYANPRAMIDGEIHPPGVFLQATAVLERQMIAYCFDRWAASGIEAGAIPGKLQEVLDAVESEAGERFPNAFLGFVEGHKAGILRDFLALFPDLPPESREHLGNFLMGSEAQSGVANRVMNRLHQLTQERKSLSLRIDRLKDQKKRLEALPRDEKIDEELEGVLAERGALMALRRRMNDTATLNFFTDEGLLPNYAFPEEGVTLQTVILRRLSQSERSGEDAGRRYERVNFQIQRSGQAALSELAPMNRFYAVGRQVEIDQVDLNVSEAQPWRLCDRCHYMENLAVSGDPYSVCPRCGSPQWSDSGRKRSLLRLRQVYATADDRSSRIGDDSDQRTPVFFNRQMLIDVPPGAAARAYRITNPQIPFGFEYLPKVNLREINFGQPGADEHEFSVAGDLASRPGFQLCRHCGKVRRKSGNVRPGFQHAYDCKLRRPGAVETDEDYFDSLYLFRELESEAVRILLPLAEVGTSGKRLHSLIAALNLGLRQYFRGNVDHIQVAHQSEPTGGESRKHYLVLFDSVPGGTGYLKELLRRPENLMRLLRGAYDVIRHCECRNDGSRDGCYSCLLAYRESRKMDEISRQAAEEILEKILAESENLEPIEGLGNVEINALLESELEKRFIETLSNAPGVSVSPQLVNGKAGFFVTVSGQGGGGRASAWKLEPQVKLGPANGVAIQTQPDFAFWPVRQSGNNLPVVVYADGFQFHYSKLDDDTAKRQAVLDSGQFRVWTFGWHTLPMGGSKLLNPAPELLSAGQQKLMQDMFTRLAPKGGWQAYGEYGNTLAEGSFKWLLTYLSGDEEGIGRLRYAALSRALGLLNPATLQNPGQRAGLLAELRTFMPAHIADIWPGTEKDPSVLGASIGGEGPGVEGICIGARLPRSAIEAASSGNLIPMESEVSVIHGIDDSDARQDKAFERRWMSYWDAANILQFLPHLILTSSSGVQGGLYGISGKKSGAGEPGGKPEPAGEKQGWVRVREQSLLGDELRKLEEIGVPLPEVGHETVDQTGEVLPELELAWLDARTGVVLEASETELAAFARLGWTVFVGIDDQVVEKLAATLNIGT